MTRAALRAALAAIFTCSAPALGSAENACEREMARAARSYGVPLGVLYAVGLAETGRGDSLRPYALNIEGKSVYDIGKHDALRRFQEARLAGVKMIDVGCMQINHHFHARSFSSVEDMLDPSKNVDYAARFLQAAEGAGRQLDAGSGALSRRARQRPCAEEIRVPGDRQSGCVGFWRLDCGRARILPTVTVPSGIRGSGGARQT